MKIDNFFSELKRRNVYKVAITDIERQGAVLQAYYFANLYSGRPAGHAMLRDPRVKAMLVRYGLPAYWREKGWPAGCRPLGEKDFECGTDAAPVH